MPRLNSLCSRLYEMEDNFLAAMDGDDHTMEAFCDSWASLRRDIQRAEATGVLTQQMAELAYTVSMRVSTIAEAFQNMDEVAQQLTNELDRELELLVGDPVQDETRSKEESCSVSRSAPYIRPGYAWLLENLHNPYPSKEVKEVFAKESGSSVKLIDSWFVDVRKRIGWSRIKRERFQNKRKPLIDAATAFFVTGGPLAANLGAEFAEMAGIAKDLYSHKFCQSDLAIKLASKPSDRLSSPSPPRFPYPSPRQSPGHSSSSSPEYKGKDVMPNSPSASHSATARTCDALSRSRKRVRSEDTPEPGPRGNKRARQVLSLWIIVLSLEQLHRCEFSPRHPNQRAITPTLSPVAFPSSPSPTADTHQPSSSRALPKRSGSDSSNQCWAKTPPTTGRIAGLQSLSVPILPSARRKHVRKSSSLSPIINDSVLQGNGPAQSFPSNPSSDEVAILGTQPSSRSSSLQLDYALPGMAYPFSAEVPAHVQPTEIDALDFSLISNDFFQNYQLPPLPSDNGSLFTIPTTFEDTVPPLNDNVDLSSLSGLFDGTLSDNQLLDSLSIPSNLDPVMTPPVQSNTFLDFTEVDINLSSFFSTLPISSGRLPGPPASDIVSVIEHNTKYPEMHWTDPIQAKKLAQLEQLKRYGTQLQECIKSLERQIAT